MSTASRLLPPSIQGATVNADQRLYVMPCFGGFTCLGFDVAERIRAAVVAWCGLSQADTVPGTLEHLQAYDAAMTAGREYHRRTMKQCTAELTPQLIGLEGCRVEVTDAHGEVRRFNVGRSGGWMPCHLEIARNGARGGPAVMGAPFKRVLVVRAAGAVNR